MLLTCRRRHHILSIDLISYNLRIAACPHLFTSCAGTVSAWQHLLLMWAPHLKPTQHKPYRLGNNRCLQLSPPHTLRMHPPTDPTPTGPHLPSFSMGHWLLSTALMGLRHTHMLRVVLLVLEVLLGQTPPSRSSSSSSGCIILYPSSNSSSCSRIMLYRCSNSCSSSSSRDRSR